MPRPKPLPVLKTATGRAVAAAGLVVGLALALPLVLGRVYVGVDLARTDVGYLCELASQTGNLWLAPHLGNGQPMFADPQFQLLYPLRWLATAFAPDVGASVAAIAQLALGAAGAAWLARSFGARALPAACAGVAFGLSGTALDLIRHGSYLAGAAWLPWAWAAGRRVLLGDPSRRTRAVLFAALALLLFGADPQMFAVAALILGVEALTHRRRPHARTRVLAVAALGLAAVACGLLQWLPASAELALTARGAPLAAAEVLQWSYGPPMWAATVLRGLLDERVMPGTTFWYLATGQSARSPWNGAPYLGLLALTVGTLAVRHRVARPAVIVAGACLVLALGDALPFAGPMVDVLPFLGAFRYPAKLLLPFALAMSIAASVVLSRLRAVGAARRPFLIATGGALGAGAVAAAAIALSSARLDAWAAAGGRVEDLRGALPQLSQLMLAGALQALVPLGIAVVAVATRARWVPLLPAALCLDLALAAPFAAFTGPPFAARPSGYASDDRRVVCATDELSRRRRRVEGEGPASVESLSLRALAIPNLNACDGLRAGVAYSVVQTRLNARLQRSLSEGRAAAARGLGCTALASLAAPIDEPAAPLNSSGLPLFAINDPLPPAFVARTPVLFATEAEAADAVVAAHSADAAASVVDDPLGRLGTSVLPSNADAVVQLERSRITRLALAISGTGPAVVGVATSYQAGWRAEQGGQALPIVRLAGAQLGVVVGDVAAGPVVLDYSPPRGAAAIASFCAGLMMLAVTLVKTRGHR